MTEKSSDLFFYGGLVLLFIGAVGLTFAAFFAIIGLAVFAIGVITVSISKRKWKQKLISIGLFVSGVLVFWPVWTQLNTVGPEVFLIPNEYRGCVNIIYKEGCGKNLEKSRENIIHRIPENGILILNAEQKFGFIDHTYFLVDENGNKTELPKMDVRDFNEEWTLEKNPNEPPRDKLGVFHWGRTGSMGREIDKNGNVTNEDELYTFSEFYISTYNDLTQRFDFKYEREFESLLEKELKKCK